MRGESFCAIRSGGEEKPPVGGSQISCSNRPECYSVSHLQHVARRFVATLIVGPDQHHVMPVFGVGGDPLVKIGVAAKKKQLGFLAETAVDFQEFEGVGEDVIGVFGAVQRDFFEPDGILDRPVDQRDATLRS